MNEDLNNLDVSRNQPTMYLCRRCIAYLAGPEEIIDPNSLGDGSPPVRTIMPSGRCACCGDTLGAEDCFQEWGSLEDLPKVQQLDLNLEETFRMKGGTCGFAAGGLVALLAGIGGLLHEGFGARGWMYFIFALPAGVLMFGSMSAISFAGLSHLFLWLINRHRVARATFERREFIRKTDALRTGEVPDRNRRLEPPQPAISDHIQETIKDNRSQIQPPPLKRGLREG